MSKRTPKGSALTDLILEVFRLNGAMLDAGNRLTKPLGLTSARWQVMGAMDEASQSMTVAQIARRMGLARQGVQRIVNELEKQGLLSFEPNIDHKRAPLVTISPVGRKVMNKVNSAQAAWVNEFAAGLSERQLRQAVKLLKSIRKQSEDK